VDVGDDVGVEEVAGDSGQLLGLFAEGSDGVELVEHGNDAGVADDIVELAAGHAGGELGSGLEVLVVLDVALDDVDVLAVLEVGVLRDLLVGLGLAADEANDGVVGVLGVLLDELVL